MNFTLNELLRSRVGENRGIDNTPSDEIKRQLEFTIAGLQRIRCALGRPMIITSGYRCPELNLAVGGVESSQHVKGEAADFISPSFGRPSDITEYLSDRMGILGIDQLILESSWVHVSFTTVPRGIFLKSAKAVEG